MPQIVFIHGGDSFNTYSDYLSYLKQKEVSLERLIAKRWKDTLQPALGDKVQVLAPLMPCNQNAKYLEWKIWFEKLIPLLTDNVILIGHSLGGIFLAKYLAEHTLPLKIKALFLIAAPYDETSADYSLADFVLPKNLAGVSEQSENIYLFHSQDDPIVPFADVLKYQQAWPAAHLKVFEDRGHFNEETFPEIVAELRKII